MKNEQSEILAAALGYLARGWRPLPVHGVVNGNCTCGKDCGNPGKHPRIAGWNDESKVSVTETTLRKWFTQWPIANIGVATGASSQPEAGFGLLVLDIDNHGVNGFEALARLQQQHNILPKTLTQRTGGGGEQRFFGVSLDDLKQIRNAVGGAKKRTSHQLPPGLDLRVTGGQVVVSPSVHASGRRYEWVDPLAPVAVAPAWFVTLCKPSVELPTGMHSSLHPSTNQTTAYGRKALETECANLAGMAPETGRNTALNTAAYKLGSLVAGGEIAEHDALKALAEAASACNCPGADATIKSGFSAGMNAPRSKIDGTALLTPVPHQTRERFNLATISAADLQTKEIAPLRWVVPGLLPEGLAILAGRPKMGKSLAALSLALSVAGGGIAFGRFKIEQPHEVLYMALEDSNRRMKSRVNAMTMSAPAPRNLHLVYSDNPELIRARGRIDLVVADWLEDHPNTRLVIVDTLGAIRGAAKKGSDLYAEDYSFMRGLQTPAHQQGAAVLVVHHLSKAKYDDVFDSVAGTTGLTGACDTLFALTRVPGGPKGTGVLAVRGRDIGDELWTVSRGAGLLWTITGDADDPQNGLMTAGRRAIVEALAAKPLSASGIATAIGGNGGAVRKMLREMVSAGLIHQVESRGVYFVSNSSQDKTPSVAGSLEK